MKPYYPQCLVQSCYSHIKYWNFVDQNILALLHSWFLLQVTSQISWLVKQLATWVLSEAHESASMHFLKWRYLRMHTVNTLADSDCIHQLVLTARHTHRWHHVPAQCLKQAMWPMEMTKVHNWGEFLCVIWNSQWMTIADSVVIILVYFSSVKH